MKIELLSNTKNKDISISNDVFSKEFNESLIHQAVVSFMAASRQGSAKQKNRSEVRGGGKKPYRQKGTGGARHGDRNAPIFRKGGVYKGPKPRSHSHDLNKKFRKLGIKHALSSKVSLGKVVFVDEINTVSYTHLTLPTRDDV